MPKLIEKPAVDSITRLVRSHNIPHCMIPELTKDIEMRLRPRQKGGTVKKQYGDIINNF